MNKITITPFEIHVLASQVYEFISKQMNLSHEEIKFVLHNIVHTIEMRDAFNESHK